MSILRNCIYIALGSLLSVSCMAGVLENEWFSPNKGRKLALLQYLAFKSPEAAGTGPITIYVHQKANQGYVAYAQTLSKIIRDKFPDQKLRIIIYHDPEARKRIQTFQFDPTIEVMTIPSDADLLHKSRAQTWLDDASLVFAVSPTHLSCHFNERFYIDLVQLGFTGESTEAEHKRLSSLIAEYRRYMDQAPEDDDSYFKYYFFNNRIKISALKVWKNPNISDSNLPPSLVAQQILTANHNKRLSSPKEQPAGSMQKTTASQIHLGLSPLAAGLLISPHIIELSRLTEEKDQSRLILELEKEEPELKALLDELTLSQSNGYRFYMAYMHNLFKIAEYIAIVSYLEPDTTPVILANFKDLVTGSEHFPKLMAKFGIMEVHVTNLETGETHTIQSPLSEGRSVRLIKLPQIKNERAYASLFALSQNPVGVTGNQSLSMAIAFGKIPLYDINLSNQKDINAFLASFDSTGLLAPAFNNSISPEEKTSAISKHGEMAKNWSANILREKMANDIIDTYIKLTLSPDSDIEQLLVEINTLFDNGSDSANNVMVHDALLVKRLFAQLNSVIGMDQSINEHAFWKEALLIYNRIKDPDIRCWFYNFFF